MISTVAGVVAGVSAFGFSLPFPIVFAVITSLLDLIPQWGATLAALVLVLAGLTTRQLSHSFSATTLTSIGAKYRNEGS
jgi:predicted PurR-regulated permease PerM